MSGENFVNKAFPPNTDGRESAPDGDRQGSMPIRGTPNNVQAQSIAHAAKVLYNLGFNVVPVDSEKKPIGSWSASERLVWDELEKRLPRASGVAITGSYLEDDDYGVVVLDLDDVDAASEVLGKVFGVDVGGGIIGSWPARLCGQGYSFCGLTGPRPKGRVKCDCKAPGEDCDCVVQDTGEHKKLSELPRGMYIVVRVVKRCLPRSTTRSEAIEVMVSNYEVVYGKHPSGVYYQPVRWEDGRWKPIGIEDVGQGEVITCDELKALIALIKQSTVSRLEEVGGEESNTAIELNLPEPSKDLSEESINQIINLVRPLWWLESDEGKHIHDSLLYLISSLMRRAGVKYEVARRVIEAIINTGIQDIASRADPNTLQAIMRNEERHFRETVDHVYTKPDAKLWGRKAFEENLKSAIQAAIDKGLLSGVSSPEEWFDAIYEAIFGRKARRENTAVPTEIREEGEFFVFQFRRGNYLVGIDGRAVYVDGIYMGDLDVLLSKDKRAIEEAINRVWALQGPNASIGRDELELLVEVIRRGGYETFTKDLIKIGLAHNLLNELNKAPKLNQRITIAAKYLVDAAIEHFGYVKNFMTPEGVDLGVHCWDGRRYKPCEGDVGKWLEGVYRALKLEYYGIRYTVLNKEEMARLMDRTREKAEYEPMMIAFNNCVFDWETLECLPHDPNRVVFHYIPHDLDVSVLREALENGVTDDLADKHTPKTLRAFKDWVGDKWVILYEVMGSTLYPRPIKKAFLLTDAEDRHGKGDTGKSTFIRLLRRALGSENTSAVSLHDLVDPSKRFAASQIYRKLANFYADLPKEAITDVGKFKVLTGEDPITIEFKYKQPFTWLPYAKHIFSANEPPPVSNADDAFWNRWIVIEFIGAFPQKIRDFEESLVDELPKTLALAIAAFKAVLDRGTFSFENTPEDARFKWMTRSNSVFAFIQWLRSNGALIEDPAGRVRVSELYRYYAMWCQVNGRSALKQNLFTIELKREGFEIRMPERRSTIIGYALDTEALNKLLGEEDQGLLGSEGEATGEGEGNSGEQ